MSASSKRKREELDLKTRYDIIQFSRANPRESTRKFAEKFNCGRTQIQVILKKKDEILKNYEANCSSNIKRSRGAKHDEIDNVLVDWFRKARSKNMPITGPMLKEKAMQIAKALDVPQDEFKASNGWLGRFKKRNGITGKFISGEAGDVSEDTVDSWQERLSDILQGWAPQNIWNMDETGQLFRALPNKSLAEASRKCTGEKRSKERLTCALFVNAAGDKEKPIIIGKSANPRCFRGISERHSHATITINQKRGWKVVFLKIF